MLTFRPENEVVKFYAKRIPAGQWNKHEQFIRARYANGDTLEKIRTALIEHDFTPTPDQLYSRLKSWKLTGSRPRNFTLFSTNSAGEGDEVLVSPDDFPLPGPDSHTNMYFTMGVTPTAEGDHTGSSNSGNASDADRTSTSTSSDSMTEQCALLPISSPFTLSLSPVRYFEFRRQPVRAQFWEDWDHEDLILRGLAVADFFCASQLFELAFKVSYRLLCELLTGEPQRSGELMVAAMLSCMRTACTPEQYYRASMIAKFPLKDFTDRSFPTWLLICVKIYEEDLLEAYEKLLWEPRLFPEELIGPRNILPETYLGMKQRENLLVAMRVKEQTQRTGTCASLLSQVKLPTMDLSTILNSPPSHSEMYNRYHCRGTSQRLLEWCAKILEEELSKTGSFLLEFSQPCARGTTTAGTKRFLSDSFFMFLLRVWPRKTPLSFLIPLESMKLSTTSNNDDDMAVHFDLFEALAVFSPLVMAKIPSDRFMGMTDVSFSTVAPTALETVKKLLEKVLPFHRIFLQNYWNRIGTHVSKIARSPINQQIMQALLDFASSLGNRHISNFDIVDKGRDLLPAVTASPTPRIVSAMINKQPVPSYNDPLLFKRRSRSSSVWSHLSAIDRSQSRGSDMSTNSKDKRPPSSAAMSVDSWRLNAYLPMSDTSSMCESTRDSESLMMDIEEEPGWI